MKKFLYTLICTLICFYSISFAQNNTNLEERSGWVWINYLGMSESFNSMLYMNLEGQDDISVRNAQWDGKSFTNSAYYAMKLEKWKNNRGKGLEWVHHKIYLASDVTGVDSYSISDGFNLLFFNVVNPVSRFGKNAYLRLGAGLVFAHMDVTLTGRDRFYMDGGIRGSYLAGVAAQVALDKWVKTYDKHFVTVETKFTAAYSRGPVSTNFAEYSVVPNYAFHVILGVGTKPHKHKTVKDTLKTMAIPSIYMGSVGYVVNVIDEM